MQLNRETLDPQVQSAPGVSGERASVDDRRVSIVVACRNERGSIHEFLQCVLNQQLGGIEWEAVIADGMSDDGTAEILEEFSRQNQSIRILKNEEKIVSTGLNAAVRAARGEIIIRMDVHTSYAPDYCQRCLEVLDRTGADNVGGPARTVARSLVGRAVSAAYHSRFSTGGARFHQENYEGYVDTIPYGCWRKTTLERFGLFDETLIRNQDDELNLRIVRNGGKVWQSPHIVSWYYPRASLRGLFRQYLQYGFWKVAVIRKHRVPASWRHLVPGLFILVNVALLVSILAGVVAAVPNVRWPVRVWVGLNAAYLASTFAVALVVARRHGWALFPILPIVFSIYHVSYGIGFAIGIFHFYRRDASRPSAKTAFTKLSR